MVDRKTPIVARKRGPAIDDAEVERRRANVHMAGAENRLEGIARNPATDKIFNAYVRGEIDATDIVLRLRAQLCL
jgi:hypothetical protein